MASMSAHSATSALPVISSEVPKSLPRSRWKTSRGVIRVIMGLRSSSQTRIHHVSSLRFCWSTEDLPAGWGIRGKVNAIPG